MKPISRVGGSDCGLDPRSSRRERRVHLESLQSPFMINISRGEVNIWWYIHQGQESWWYLTLHSRLPCLTASLLCWFSPQPSQRLPWGELTLFYIFSSYLVLFLPLCLPPPRRPFHQPIFFFLHRHFAGCKGRSSSHLHQNPHLWVSALINEPCVVSA